MSRPEHGQTRKGLKAVILSEDDLPLLEPPNLLSHLSPGDREAVLGMGARQHLVRGAGLFHQGDQHEGIYVIEDGLLRVFFASRSGRAITLGYWGPGHFAGGPDVFGGIHLWSGEAAEDTTVVMLSGNVIRRLIHEMPELAIGIIEGLSFKGRCYSVVCQMLGTATVAGRLSHLLLQLASLYGVKVEAGILIDVPFTHDNLASLVGASRQWVTTTLRKLEHQGAIGRQGTRLVLCRPEMIEGID